MAGLGSYSVSIITKDLEHIYFDGGLLVNDLQGIAPPELRMTSFPSPLRDITYVDYTTYAPRKITAFARLSSKKRCSIWVLRQELFRAFNPLRGPVTLCFNLEDRNLTYYLNSVILGDILDSVVSSNGDIQYAEFPLSLLACDPMWYGLSHTYLSGAIDGFGRIDETTTIVVDGNWRSKPIITLTGPMENVKIASVYNTDIFIELFYGIDAGEVVTVDTRYGLVYNQLGDTVALTKDSSMSSFFFAPTILTPTGFNAITVYATDCDPGVYSAVSTIAIVSFDTYYAV